MTILSTFAVACVFAASAQPQAQAEQVTPFQFLDAIIASLARSHMAIKAVNEKANDPSLVERMTANQNASIEVVIATRNIQRFASAQDDNLRAAVAGTIDAYEMLRESMARQLALYEKLDAAKSPDDLAGLKRQISDAKVAYQQASAILVEATTVAFMSVIIADPQDPTNHVALNMSTSEKAQLVKALEQRFGSALRKKKSDDDTGPMQAAKSLLAYLEKNWKYAK